MAADRWGVSWGGDQGIWGISWTLGVATGTTFPEYGPPFITAHSEMTTNLSRYSPITPFITRRAEIDEDQ
jgi:hypothetical protein